MNWSGGDILAICIGNPLREDDGVAWRVAAELEQRLPELPLIVAIQPLPEMAMQISDADAVVFVDAAIDVPPGEVRETELSPDPGGSWDAHALTPATLLAAATKLGGRCPPASLLAVGGERWGHGEQLSDRVGAAVPDVVERIIRKASLLAGGGGAESLRRTGWTG